MQLLYKQGRFLSHWKTKFLLFSFLFFSLSNSLPLPKLFKMPFKTPSPSIATGLLLNSPAISPDSEIQTHLREALLQAFFSRKKLGGGWMKYLYTDNLLLLSYIHQWALIYDNLLFLCLAREKRFK